MQFSKPEKNVFTRFFLSYPKPDDMKRNLHNLNLGFIQLKRNVHFDSTDHDCLNEPPRSE